MLADFPYPYDILTLLAYHDKRSVAIQHAKFQAPYIPGLKRRGFTAMVINQRRVRAEIYARGHAALPISVFEATHPESQRKFFCVVKPAAEKSGLDDWQMDAFSGTVWLIPEDQSYIALFFPKHPVIVMYCEGVTEDFDVLRRAGDNDALEALAAYRNTTPGV